MISLIADGSEKADLIFRTGDVYEVFIAGPRMTGPNLIIYTANDLAEVNRFLVRLSEMIKINEEHSVVVEVLIESAVGGEDHWYRYGIDMETGSIFPEFE